ncbi:hypothetical protein GCM10009754_57650 [Amycolatopsis minnesotensis]|uniref:Uncharacterized protein n=1 Tax=Amycolatopsis minnesotensis TaxID=337894 RepID=A0ABN2RU38_9PSEU
MSFVVSCVVRGEIVASDSLKASFGDHAKGTEITAKGTDSPRGELFADGGCELGLETDARQAHVVSVQQGRDGQFGVLRPTRWKMRLSCR